MKLLFDAAEDGHAIILFDEADSLFAKPRGQDLRGSLRDPRLSERSRSVSGGERVVHREALRGIRDALVR
jgi:hypothetical protein